MKKSLLTLGIFAITTSVIAQKKGKTNTSSRQKVQLEQTYKNALKYADLQTVISTTHQLIALEGEISTYKDSLALLYFNANNAVSCHLLCKELLVSKPTDTTLLELNAISLKSLGVAKDAVEAYERLFAVTQNRIHGYELAQLQYSISRLAESLVTINQSIAKTKEIDAKIRFNIDKDKKQEVPLNAALLNLKGLVSFELKDEKGAADAFNQALTIMPDFAAADQNKKAMEALGEIKK